jgi:ubiquinone/menaquinone biosynthesis C-methylase UbiE
LWNGALTLPLAEAVGEHGWVVAVDISEPMLGAAR